MGRFVSFRSMALVGANALIMFIQHCLHTDHCTTSINLPVYKYCTSTIQQHRFRSVLRVKKVDIYNYRHLSLSIFKRGGDPPHQRVLVRVLFADTAEFEGSTAAAILARGRRGWGPFTLVITVFLR